MYHVLRKSFFALTLTFALLSIAMPAMAQLPEIDRDQQVLRDIQEIEDLRRRVGSVADELEGLFDEEQTEKVFQEELQKQMQRPENRLRSLETGQQSFQNQVQALAEAIVVAAENLERGTKLDARNVRVENWPGNLVPKNAFRSLDEIHGQVIGTRLSKGMPIESSFVQDQGSPELEPPQRETLRRVARELERMAAELEEQSLYPHADKLRAEAKSYWLQAR